MPKLSKEEIKSLIESAYQSREDILNLLHKGEVHLGGAFSALDVINVLYNKILKHDPFNPYWSERDRFFLSAGHKCVALYIILAQQGYFKKELLLTYNAFNTLISMHPEQKTSGIEFPTGSLGHGLPVAHAVALCARLNRKDYKVYVMLGDGECQEGTVWEAAMTAGHYKTDNLIVIVDKNGLQVNGTTEEIMNIDPISEKFTAFGWEVRSIDGHNYNQIYTALAGVPFTKGKPSCIVSNTIKCKGLSYAEDKFQFHHWHCDSEEIGRAIEAVKSVKREELDKIGC